ncbi:DEAD/DEAH box helicase [Porphyromonas circumdentaria]|uniref:DEAD/DEAH box helicase n=1 Tax=Porphyromonas circumdentaria TaxID=29524 RepID=UPI0026DD2BC7|nr:DEAD/DEAH box helicase [Porphyromonas circumdentaria]MDO4722991.1 DEAD/DEAH box helicase [Porphyromonas circumdentaria]
MDFFEFDLEDAVLDGLEAMNFITPTPIQEAAIPSLLSGRDLLGCAQTGTGKTAAYLLPIVNRIYLGEFNEDSIKAVIMAPTRELAQQIDQQIEGFAYYLSISSTAIYGGTDGVVWAQTQRSLEKGTDIVVATPGRLISMLNLNMADISKTAYFVIDEADRMLDMGFYDDIMNICRLLPKDCQMVLFSATMPPKIASLAEMILKDPVRIELSVSKPPTTIKQYVSLCHEEQKLAVLKKFFSNEEFVTKGAKTVLFASSKLKVHQLAQAIKKEGLSVAEMHSNLTQAERDQVMRQFKMSAFDILVATDIVARGIDIDDIELVVNYDMPKDPEDYVHRIGRTARGNSEGGTAFTLVTERDLSAFYSLEHFLGYTVVQLPVDEDLGSVPVYAPKQGAKTWQKRGRRRRPSARSQSSTKSSSAKKVAKRSKETEHKEAKKRSSLRKKPNYNRYKKDLTNKNHGEQNNK